MYSSQLQGVASFGPLMLRLVLTSTSLFRSHFALVSLVSSRAGFGRGILVFAVGTTVRLATI